MRGRAGEGASPAGGRCRVNSVEKTCLKVLQSQYLSGFAFVAQARGLPGGLSGRQRARLFHALKIPFDRAFASTVNVGEGYHIFLTPNGVVGS